MLAEYAATYNELDQSASDGATARNPKVRSGTHMGACADGKDWVNTRGRVGVELDIKNLDDNMSARVHAQRNRGSQWVHAFV
jgi:hypothetical protein